MEGRTMRGQGCVGVAVVCVLLMMTHMRTVVSSRSSDVQSLRFGHTIATHVHPLLTGPRRHSAGPKGHIYRGAIEEGVTKNVKQLYRLIAGPRRHSAEDHASNRHRRASGEAVINKNKFKRGFTTKEQDYIVDRHNEIRAKLNSSNMLMMHWNLVLEQMAQNWSDRCSYDNRPLEERKINSSEFKIIGENYFSASIYNSVEDFLNNWSEESVDYNFSANTCSYFCDRYKQMVWANTSNVGCGITFCEDSPDFEGGDYRVVCNYGPIGNIPGLRPYAIGKACSECASDFQQCQHHGLCARKSHAAVNVVSLLSLGYCLLWFLICSV